MARQGSAGGAINYGSCGVLCLAPAGSDRLYHPDTRRGEREQCGEPMGLRYC